jgi:hypothetical protein
VSKTACSGCWIGGGDNNNYYDNALALYLTYYRTGQSVYLAAAQTWADRWWRSPYIDQGRMGGAAMRVIGYFGLLVRAKELLDGGDPTMINAIGTYVDGISTSFAFEDIREDGYLRGAAAILAAWLPAGSLKTAMITRVQGYLANYTTERQTGGWWGQFGSAGSSWNGNLTGTVSVTNGATTFQHQGSDSQFSGKLPDGTKFVFCRFTTVRSCDPVGYTITGVTSAGGTLDRPYEGATISVGSPSNQFAALIDGQGYLGFGTTFFQLGIVGIAHSAMQWAFTQLSDPTRAALAAGYAQDVANFIQSEGRAANGRGIQYGARWVNCVAPLGAAIDCSYTEQQGRELASEIFWAMSAAENATPSGTREVWTDSTMGSKYGFITPCPDCDGTFETALGNAEARWTFGKWRGYYFGLGHVSAWDAARAGGVGSPVLVSRAVQPRLANVSGAASVRVTAIRPDGTSASSATCTSGPCTVQVDTRQSSGWQMVIEYWSGAGATGTLLSRAIQPVT